MALQPRSGSICWRAHAKSGVQVSVAFSPLLILSMPCAEDRWGVSVRGTGEEKDVAHLIPPLDDVPGTDLELEGLLEEAARGVEN